jgi:lysylphosphatidylglycerol synthetase-like protein (DUF2156 family)
MKRLLWQFFATLIIIAVLFHFIWWIAAIAGIIAAVVGLWWLAMMVCRDQDAALEREAQREAGLRARADEQHNWVMQGDERGTYGPDGAAVICRAVRS